MLSSNRLQKRVDLPGATIDHKVSEAQRLMRRLELEDALTAQSIINNSVFVGKVIKRVLAQERGLPCVLVGDNAVEGLRFDNGLFLVELVEKSYEGTGWDA